MTNPDSPDDGAAGRKTVGGRTIAIVSAIAACVAAVAAFSGNLLSIRDNLRKMIVGGPSVPLQFSIRDIHLAFREGPDMLVLEVVGVKKGDEVLTDCKGQLTLNDGHEYLSQPGPGNIKPIHDFPAGAWEQVVRYAFRVAPEVNIIGVPFRVRCGELGKETIVTDWKEVEPLKPKAGGSKAP